MSRLQALQPDDGEWELLKQAKQQKDWSILPTQKLRYLYSRYIALPKHEYSVVKAIAAQAQGFLKLGEELL